MSTRAYTIAEDGKSITCHFCGRTSHNQQDVANVYCGHCHCFFEPGLDTGKVFTDNLADMLAPVIGTRRYILIVGEPAEQDGQPGLTVAAATNMPPALVRELLTGFLANLEPPNETQNAE